MPKPRRILFTLLAVLLFALLGRLAVEAWAKRRSPFPLPPVPHLTNEQSALPEFEVLSAAVEQLLRQWQLHGASLAIAHRGRLIYARGFGYANVALGQEVQPHHVFRVASVSKLITAAAVMKLQEEGKLALSDRVFGAAGILNDSLYKEFSDWRVLTITVKHLLEHSGGWTTRWGDPMFMGKVVADARRVPLPVSAEDVAAFVLSKRVHFAPGSLSWYSNVGYVLLGKVVERAAGMPYEEYVRTALLLPMGVGSMRVGNSYPRDFFADEVAYYDLPEAKPTMAFDDATALVERCSGGYDIRTLGAAGGWVASPAALVRFALCIDGQPEVPDILAPTSIEKMVHNDSGFDPLGWRAVSDRRLLRTGTLAGTSAVLVSDTAGFCWAFVTNTGAWKGAAFTFIIENVVSDLIDREAHKWQGLTHDLFCSEQRPAGGR